MSNRNRAIQICKDLAQTISKIRKSVLDSPFEVPSVSKRELEKIKRKLMKKHSITKDEINV